MKAPTLLAVLAVLVLVVGGGVLIVRGLAPAVVSTASEDDGAIEDEVEPDPRASGGDTPAPRVEREEDQGVADEGGSASGAPAGRLRGRVVLSTPDGVAHREEDGVFTPRFWIDPELVSGDPVAVTGGSFEFDAPANTVGSKLSLHEIRFDGRRAHSEDRLDADPAVPLVFHARWYESFTLHVVDADAGRELGRVQVVRADHWDTGDLPHPGVPDPGAMMLEGAASPITLEFGAGSQDEFEDLWIGADGYQWQRLFVDYRVGGERRIELERGAKLSVQVEGDPPDGWRLRVRVPPVADGETQAEDDGEEVESADEVGGAAEERAGVTTFPLLLELDPGNERRFQLEGLPAGLVVVCGELGDGWDEPLLLGSAPVTLDVERSEHVILGVGAAEPSMDPVPFAGTFYLPPAWGALRPRLSIEALDERPGAGDQDRTLRPAEFEAVSGEPGLYHWDAGAVLPGKYELAYDKLGKAAMVEVGEFGRTDVVFELAAPADVVVRLQDVASGDPVTGLEIAWHATESSWASPLGGAEWDEAQGSCTLRVPEIDVTFMLWDDEWNLVGGADCQLSVRPGVNEVTLPVRRNIGLFVVATVNGEKAPVREQLVKTQIQSLDEAHRIVGWGIESKGYRVTVSDPGTYRVEFADFPGYFPVPPREVEVVPGGYVRVEVELTPQR